MTESEQTNLEMWKECLPKDKDSISITFEPFINETMRKVEWSVYLRSDKMEPSEYYSYNCSFSPVEYMRMGVDEGALPLEMDYVVSEIETALYEVFRSYIYNEVIANE